MLIDRSHLPWAGSPAAVAAACGIHYCFYASRTVDGPSGATVEGLGYGVSGYLLILLGAALSLRRKVPGWRIGNAQVWLKAHIWLCLLSVPLIFYHSGMRMGGGTLAHVLMVLFLTIGQAIPGGQALAPRTQGGDPEAACRREGGAGPRAPCDG